MTRCFASGTCRVTVLSKGVSCLALITVGSCLWGWGWVVAILLLGILVVIGLWWVLGALVGIRVLVGLLVVGSILVRVWVVPGWSSPSVVVIGPILLPVTA